MIIIVIAVVIINIFIISIFLWMIVSSCICIIFPFTPIFPRLYSEPAFHGSQHVQDETDYIVSISSSLRCSCKFPWKAALLDYKFRQLNLIFLYIKFSMKPKYCRWNWAKMRDCMSFYERKKKILTQVSLEPTCRRMACIHFSLISPASPYGTVWHFLATRLVQLLYSRQ